MRAYHERRLPSGRPALETHSDVSVALVRAAAGPADTTALRLRLRVRLKNAPGEGTGPAGATRTVRIGAIPGLTATGNCCILTTSSGDVSETPARRRRFYDLQHIFDIAVPMAAGAVPVSKCGSKARNGSGSPALAGLLFSSGVSRLLCRADLLSP